MARFVHLTPEKNVDGILRSGITQLRRQDDPEGIFAMPVARSFYVSHQWLGEQKNAGTCALRRSTSGCRIPSPYEWVTTGTRTSA